jgi:hypothetical protein
MSFKLFERGVPIRVHSIGESRAARANDRERFKSVEIFWTPHSDERVQAEIGEYLTQPEPRQVQPTEHLKCVTKLVECDQVKEWLQIHATRTIGVRFEQAGEIVRRRFSKFARHVNPEVAT